MKSEFLASEIASAYPFQPTPEQNRAMEMLSEFVCSSDERRVFLLKGYAGTGKTTLVGTLVKTLCRHSVRVVLMAPTGRAAKVFSAYSGMQACTIHRRIYRQKSVTETDSFQLDRNMSENTLFLVDEASMISNEGLSGTVFGTGRLLDDLLRYVFSGRGCSLVMLGDTAQLPPVGETDSPALSAAAIAAYGLNVRQMCLVDVVRQMHESGILFNATRLRESLADGVFSGFRFRICGFSDVTAISGADLIETISGCYSRDGIDETMVLCRSNRRAVIYNNGIRNTVLDREDELCRGDMLMIVKNNYYWTSLMAQEEDRDSYISLPSFIANGDIAVVHRVRRRRELYGFTFEDAVLSFPDYDIEADVTLLLDTLHSESPSLTREESDRLFGSVMQDYEDIPAKKDRFMKLRENRHFNALQVKYAYAVTCHKAQGGQWRNIFIDQGHISEDMRDADYFRWLYTALTRATGHVYLVNWPEDGLDQ